MFNEITGGVRDPVPFTEDVSCDHEDTGSQSESRKLHVDALWCDPDRGLSLYLPPPPCVNCLGRPLRLSADVSLLNLRREQQSAPSVPVFTFLLLP